jgi:hypothetical protein
MRNFLYNKSDILIAIIIIVVAAVIIWSRVNAIMNSGDEKPVGSGSVSEEISEPDVQTETPDAGSGQSAGEVQTSEGALGEDPLVTSEGAVGEEQPVLAEPVEFTVAMGSAASTVADDLESVGLVESADVFLSELTAQNAETRLKAGTFTIDPGTSVTDIVKKLTN